MISRIRPIATKVLVDEDSLTVILAHALSSASNTNVNRKT